MIFMRYLFAHITETSVASQEQMTATLEALVGISRLPDWSPCPRSGTTWWPCVVSDDSRWTLRCPAGSEQPRGGLTLDRVFTLTPWQGKENTWSWSPALSADIFGKGFWLQVCVWSPALAAKENIRRLKGYYILVCKVCFHINPQLFFQVDFISQASAQTGEEIIFPVMLVHSLILFWYLKKNQNWKYCYKNVNKIGYVEDTGSFPALWMKLPS